MSQMIIIIIRSDSNQFKIGKHSLDYSFLHYYLSPMKAHLQQLGKNLSGTLHFDELMQALYATDASVYRELPLAVAYPKDPGDIKRLIRFAKEHRTSLIPRAAGTSLAGQCVGKGIVVDVSKYFTKIIELNVEERWVKVQPGVIRDELNKFLKPNGLFFGPNTATANRCMIGGMVGNNSCGSTSIKYGTTRDHVLELETILSDGSEVIFNNQYKTDFDKKRTGNQLENKLYRQIFNILSDSDIQNEIFREYPKPGIRRRNTGYAIDVLLESDPFLSGKPDFNFCKLLAGSEGTLAFTTSIKLSLDLLPLSEELVLAPHFKSIAECLKAVVTVMAFEPDACEMMDKIILDCTKGQIEQTKNRFFVEGDPEAILMIELRSDSREAVLNKAEKIKQALQIQNLGYAFPIVEPPQTKNVWALRNAGLGLLGNLPGDSKAVACIEDTAVAINDLPEYIAEFDAMMENFGQRAVHYAHAGDGELHLRPILNLKKQKEVEAFRQITETTARLVKKYNGSLSGEHGDGRVRSEFIPLMIGEKNYELLRQIKHTWDPDNIFNPGKIVDAPPMNEMLRYKPEVETPEFETVFDFSATGGMLRLAEKCNGSGDCRKVSDGTMCPSYRATLDEKDSTRARANTLREFLTHSNKKNAFDHKELKEVMDLCISCKGCTSECPSSVDMSTLKAEFLYQYYKSNGIPLRARVFANVAKLNKFAAISPGWSNLFLKNNLLKNILGIAPQRTLPFLYKQTLRGWYKTNYAKIKPKNPIGKVYLFCDEFTNFNDTEVGIKTIQLLTRLGYQVMIIQHDESGRAAISKGLLHSARRNAINNVANFYKIINEEMPLLGIEPSAILSFRDEYPKLVPESKKEAANILAKNCLLVDEFLSREIQKGNISAGQFTKEKKKILLHGHCHQKALSSVDHSAWLLNLPENYEVEVIPSGCCGMAGSFGYEKEHYEVSMKIGELVLFPAIRKSNEEVIIAAPGTSCRHQIMDGVGRRAWHPVEVLYEALLNS
ncbi:MAG: FAD/FMN-containing dehydrogenase/Fe-S oxidoreductase [Saprospiraceae bacterium]|jgi:FAD/FMN-containing dehydrogenase/Fe-S oxidoreductase